MIHPVWPRCAPLLGAVLLAVLWSSCSLINQELPNQPPQVEVRDVDTTIVSRGGRVTLTVSASDEDDDPLTYLWSSAGAGSFGDSTSNSTFWLAPTQILGNSELFLLSVTIMDNRPDTEDPVETFLIEVVQRAPVLVAAPRDTTVSFREPVVVLQASATDEDNDALTYDWEILDGGIPPERVLQGVQTRRDTSTLRLITLEPGIVPLRLTVSDGQDTLRREFEAVVAAPDMPEGGTVTLELPLQGGTRPFEIDVYEYPNQRGVEPQLVGSWFEAEALCQERGMRLCSREEWVLACQGSQGRRVSSADDREALPEQFGLRFCNEQGSDLWGGDAQNLEAVAPSGSFPNCTSGSGAFDMTGNALEWMQDWVPPEPGATSTEGVGRRASFSLSSTIFFGAACGQTSGQQVIQLETELPIPTPQSFIDSVFSSRVEPAFAEAARDSIPFGGYFTDVGSRRGFRCCR